MVETLNLNRELADLIRQEYLKDRWDMMELREFLVSPKTHCDGDLLGYSRMLYHSNGSPSYCVELLKIQKYA
jgi:hypothetical protein